MLLSLVFSACVLLVLYVLGPSLDLPDETSVTAVLGLLHNCVVFILLLCSYGLIDEMWVCPEVMELKI